MTATARMTIGSLFTTVSETANTINNVLGTVNTGVNMLNDYVTTAASKQKKDNKADLIAYEDILIERMSKEETQRQVELLQFRAKSEEHAKLFDTAYDKWKKVFATNQS